MSWFGALLALLSALCHASWNLFSKSGGDPVRFIRNALRCSTLCYFPLFLLLQPFITYGPVYLFSAISSGVVVAFYFFALSRAYQHGDVSTAYPLVRGLPVLLLALVAMCLGEDLSLTGLAGISLILFGCVVVPLKRFALGVDGFQLTGYFNRSCFWAGLAAAMTCGYTLIDKSASVAMPILPLHLAIATKVNYVYMQNTIAWMFMEFTAPASATKLKKISCNPSELYAGLVFLVSYSLVLAALALDSAAYVMSFRLVSIIITSVVSMIWIEQRFSRPRLLGVLLIFTGVVLVGQA